MSDNGLHCTLLDTMEGHTTGVISVAFSPDSQILAASSRFNGVRLWRVSNGNGTLLYTLEGLDGIESLAFSPDGRYLVSAMDTIRFWGILGP